MFWDEYERIAANFTEYKTLFQTIRQGLEQAGNDPVLDTISFANIIGVNQNQVKFVFEKLEQAGFLRQIEICSCHVCHNPLDGKHEQCSTCQTPFSDSETVRFQAYVFTHQQNQVSPSYALVESLARSARIGVITALPKEALAVHSIFERIESVKRQTGSRVRIYEVGTIKSLLGKSHSIVHVCLGDMGNNSAAIRASTLMSDFPQVNHIVMVGIAGGVPNSSKAHDHVRLGDIVVSDRYGVVQYDFIKQEKDKIIERSRPIPPSAQLLDGVKSLKIATRADRPWQKYIVNGMQTLKIARPSDSTDLLRTSDGSLTVHPEDPMRTSGEPRIFFGPIASANSLLKNASFRDALREKYGVKAVEMEASGIADATWERGNGYLVVRGICDYCDEAKNDIWQEYAAIAAAAYLAALLNAIPNLE